MLASNTSDPTLTPIQIEKDTFSPDCEFLKFSDGGGGDLSSKIEIKSAPDRNILQIARFSNAVTVRDELNIAHIARIANQ